MSNTIYVHIDTTSNAVSTRGVDAQDFNKSIVHQPKNLLLLDPSSEFGEFESHTGLRLSEALKMSTFSFNNSTADGSQKKSNGSTLMI